MPATLTLMYQESAREYPAVAWSVREHAKEFTTKGDAVRVADRLRSYGTVVVVPAKSE